MQMYEKFNAEVNETDRLARHVAPLGHMTVIIIRSFFSRK